MIEIKKHKGFHVVDSFKLYSITGLDISNYSRWMTLAKTRGGRDIDWFIDDGLLKLNRRIKMRCYFTIDFARAMCMRYRNKPCNSLNVYFKEQQSKL